MKEFKGKVAVVTGGASGIGRALAERCLKEEMIVVLADIERRALQETANELTKDGGEVLAVPTDVASAESMEALAKQVIDNYGEVHLLFNNAGVGGAPVAFATTKDWEWILGVNLWGVVHGVRLFTPIMLKQNEPAHIVNTASIAGLVMGNLGVYSVTKHAVVSLSEQLNLEMQRMNAKVGVSVLCPGFVSTKIMDSHRNRPETLQNESMPPYETGEMTQEEQEFRDMIANGTPPSDIAD